MYHIRKESCRGHRKYRMKDGYISESYSNLSDSYSNLSISDISPSSSSKSSSRSRSRNSSSISYSR